MTVIASLTYTMESDISIHLEKWREIKLSVMFRWYKVTCKVWSETHAGISTMQTPYWDVGIELGTKNHGMHITEKAY